MARYATGKKSKAISDISGFKVNYTDLKTTYDNLRVEPSDFDPKHPQLTPAKNVIDATALFQPRPDNDPENISFVVGFNTDIFASKIENAQKGIGIKGLGSIGTYTIRADHIQDVTGVSGTGEVGTISFSAQVSETEVTGTGAVGFTNSIANTLTVTVQSTGSGNKYLIDGVQQQSTYLQEGKTYRFDQSDSSNSGHPLRFSTTSNGTHAGGSEYTTGVTTVGTPGSAGAYTQIVVAGSAPDLFYYCTNHSGMGGSAKTPAAGTITLTTTVVGGNPSNHPYHNVGSSNKYAIDGSTATADVTLLLTEGTTFRFDQSDSSNSGHPLRFSTTPNGTHGGGSEYTTGVTTNGTPGSSGAYTEITVATSAPTLYYYCTNHSAMGWTAKTPTPTNVSVTVTAKVIATGVDGDGAIGTLAFEANPIITGVSGTGAIGTESVNVGGWGQEAWGSSGWGDR